MPLHPRDEALLGTRGSSRGAAEHEVHFYEDDARLTRVVAAFAGEALTGGGAAVVVATAPHRLGIERDLVGLGHDPAALAGAGRLVVLDAEETLTRFMAGGLPDPAEFRAVLLPVLDRARAAAPRGRLRAYGEMVDVLWQRGEAAATFRLEELWGELLAERSFALLCGYRLGAFGAHEHAEAFGRVAGCHSGVLPSGRWFDLEPHELLHRLAGLEQRALCLEAEVERRRRLEEERARLHEAERLARAEIELLYRLTDAANRAETVEQVYETALDGIESALGVSRAAILLLDSDGVMRFKASRGVGEAFRAAVEGQSPWRADERAPVAVLVEDARTDLRAAPFRAALAAEGIGAAGLFPLFSGGRLLGTLAVHHPAPHAFTPRERRLATAIADQVALAVDRMLAGLERERLIGIVGHDLRNPLSAITMSAAALRKRGEDGLAKPVERIAASAKRMERLITQLLGFTQARHGRGIPLHPAPADLARIARNVVEELEAAHPGRRLVLEAEGDTSGEWDPDLLAEVLSNLAGNAVQHGGDGGVTVRIRGEGEAAVAEVHNGGPAIPPEVAARLFDPFRRGPAADGRSNGIGLGLYITREIVVAHGGAIDVRSSAQDGTTFAVRLPRHAGA